MTYNAMYAKVVLSWQTQSCCVVQAMYKLGEHLFVC